MASFYCPSFTDEFDDLLTAVQAEVTEAQAATAHMATTTKKKNSTGKSTTRSTRARRKPVPEEAKDEKYWTMRRKNNEATKRCREAKRQEMTTIASCTKKLDKDLEDAKNELEKWVKKYKFLKKANKNLEVTLAQISGNLADQ